MNKVIHKGYHACLHGFRFKKKRLKFDFLVDDSWYYEPIHAGINKILGLSNGLSHMKHSIRLGWMCENGEIVLYAYAHTGDADTHVAVRLCTVERGWHSCIIKSQFPFYHVYINEVGTTIRDEFNSRIHYLLYPFFGGKDKAPHDIRFKINISK